TPTRPWESGAVRDARRSGLIGSDRATATKASTLNGTGMQPRPAECHPALNGYLTRKLRRHVIVGAETPLRRPPLPVGPITRSNFGARQTGAWPMIEETAHASSGRESDRGQAMTQSLVQGAAFAARKGAIALCCLACFVALALSLATPGRT